jgi:two-component system sensor histidine kinase/response regulator
MESKPAVLIVDDSPQNLELLEANLIPLSYGIIKAASGEEALEKLSENNIDLVMLDVMMPGINGFEVCRIIKKKAGYLPVIMITSLSDRDSRIKGIESGADDFISKPFDSIELKLKIKNILKSKNLYDDVEKSRRAIKALDELKDNLTSFIVHDLRNPLSSISGFLDLLSISKDLKKEDLVYVERANQGAKTIMGMISNLLDMGKMENNEIQVNAEDCDLEEIVSSAIKAITPMLNDNAVHLINKTNETNVTVKVQRDLAERVVQNLLSNAIRYSPEQGEISVNSAVDEVSGFVAVSVSDSGSGIPKELQQRIFDKYATVEAKTNRMRGSTGLGLAFCKLAVELHGGKIWVEDRSGGGSIFRFTLPLSGVKK